MKHQLRTSSRSPVYCPRKKLPSHHFFPSIQTTMELALLSRFSTLESIQARLAWRYTVPHSFLNCLNTLSLPTGDQRRQTENNRPLRLQRLRGCKYQHRPHPHKRRDHRPDRQEVKSTSYTLINAIINVCFRLDSNQLEESTGNVPCGRQACVRFVPRPP